MDGNQRFSGKERKVLKLTQKNKFKMIRGLTFRSINRAPIISFEFPEEVFMPIHSCFVFFKFKITYYDKNDAEIEHRVVSPWERRILPSRPFKRFVEEPL